MRKNLRNSGIDVIGNMSFGTHFCQFYQTKEDLMDILIPYFKAGLESNEFCMWVTSEPLGVEEAKEALRKAIPDLDIYLEKGQIEIIPYTWWYLNKDILDSGKSLNDWVEKLDQALASGHDGLRLSRDTFWVGKKDWNDFVNYEKEMDRIIGNYRMIALCTYSLDRFSKTEIIEVVSNHQFSLVKKEGKWEREDNFGWKKAEESAIRATVDWEQTFDAIPDLTAILDTEYRIVRANRAMAAKLEMVPEECAGLTCYRVIHGTDSPPPFCPHLQLLKDGLEHKQEERWIRRYNRILEEINRIFSNVVQAKTEKELGNACLSVALEMTGSQIGFIGEVSDDGLVNDIAISDSGWRQCFMYDKTGHRRRPGDFVVHGLYGSVVNSGKSFFTNNPPSHPDSIGVPHGHPLLTSFLGVPLIQNGKTIGVLVVANREGGYSCEQQEDLEAIAPAVTQVLQRKKAEQERKRAEEALKEAYLVLEEKVKARTAELEKAYKSLKESEKSLAEAQKMVQLGSWDWNIVTGEVYWSDELYRIFGRIPQGFGATYDAFLSYVHPEDRDYTNNAFLKALSGKPYSIDYRIISADGKERVVHEQGEAVFDEKNIPIRMRGTVQDITERKKAEEKIQNLANIMESSNDAIITKSLNGIITSWNKGAKKVYGYSAEEILGKPISILEPSFLGDETKKLTEMAKKGESIHHYETMRLRKDGTIIAVSITLSPVFDVHRKLTAISVIVRDITESKRAEEKLRESEEKYRNIVETANEGVLIIDDKAIITYANKKVTDMFGYSLEEGIGRPVWDFISEESKVTTKLNLERRQQGINGSYELKLMRKNGLPLWVHINAKALFDKDGRFMGSLSMLTDITKRKEAEEILANIEIARKKEIHHRIKNNLQVISSLLDLQAEKFNNRKNIEDSEVLEAFRESQDRVVSMALIHEELYKGGGFDTLDFSSYIEELTENLFLTYRLGNTDVNLDMDLEENIFFDMDTAVPLGMIINELVSNSLKYAFQGRDKGEIRIKFRREENGVRISSREESKNEGCKGTSFTLLVSDDGVGIPENLDIKDLDSLGFQLITSLVDQLDGKLELKRNNGTEFTIRFTVKDKI